MVLPFKVLSHLHVSDIQVTNRLLLLFTALHSSPVEDNYGLKYPQEERHQLTPSLRL